MEANVSPQEERQKCKAVFLDRDGVINREPGDFVFEQEDFKLNGGLIEALLKLKEAGFIFVVITNQSGIALGRYSHEQAGKIHSILKEQLSAAGVDIAEIYYCPHHPSRGKCLCRKPGSLMVEKAIGRFNIDPSLSFMIGDRERDTEAASAAGVRGILIKTNESLLNYVNIITGKQSH